MVKEPENERIIGVFSDDQAAEQAAAAARQAGAEEVRVSDSQDEVAALHAEMREEAADVRPGFSAPGMRRSVILWTAIAALVGLVVALPLAFVMGGDLPLVTRLLVVGFAGGATGATVGFLVGFMVFGEFFGRRRTPSSLAAERGVVVGADETTGKVTPTLSAGDAVRVDKVAPSGQPEDTVTGRRRRRSRHRD